MQPKHESSLRTGSPPDVPPSMASTRAARGQTANLVAGKPLRCRLIWTRTVERVMLHHLDEVKPAPSWRTRPSPTSRRPTSATATGNASPPVPSARRPEIPRAGRNATERSGPPSRPHGPPRTPDLWRTRSCHPRLTAPHAQAPGQSTPACRQPVGLSGRPSEARGSGSSGWTPASPPTGTPSVWTPRWSSTRCAVLHHPPGRGRPRPAVRPAAGRP